MDALLFKMSIRGTLCRINPMAPNLELDALLFEISVALRLARAAGFRHS